MALLGGWSSLGLRVCLGSEQYLIHDELFNATWLPDKGPCGRKQPARVREMASKRCRRGHDHGQRG
jgi:hypothetical protein